jgi:hypothetical protein
MQSFCLSDCGCTCAFGGGLSCPALSCIWPIITADLSLGKQLSARNKIVSSKEKTQQKRFLQESGVHIPQTQAN